MTKIRPHYSQVALLREVPSVKQHQTALVDTDFLRKLEQFLIFENNDYRTFPLDVTAAILMFQNIETERRACCCPKPIPWELQSFLMKTISFSCNLFGIKAGHVTENAL